MAEHLFKRGTRYYVRRRVPQDLVKVLGRTEIQRSLGTSEYTAAKKRCREVSVLIDAEFDAARRSVARVMPAGVGVAVNYDERPGAEWDYLEDVWEVQEERRERLVKLFNDVLDSRLGRAAADLPHTPRLVVAADAPPTQPTRSFTALLPLWARDRRPIPSTQVAMRLAVSRWEEKYPAVAVPRITKRLVVEFKDALLGECSPNVVNTTLARLSSLVAVGINQAWLDTNPFSGISVAVPSKARRGENRIPFDTDALNRIFGLPEYTAGDRPRAGRGEAAYWIPLLGLFTGARVEEIAQLSPGDIYQEQYRVGSKSVSVWVLRITDTGEGQGLKNPGSRRRIPVHQALVERGFAEYAKSRAGSKRLFDLAVSEKTGREANVWVAWWLYRIRTRLGLDKRLVFHSFRHTFKDICREVGIEKREADALQGHTEGDAAGGYGGEWYPLRPLVEAMNRYSVSGVTLPEPPGRI